MYYLLVLIYSFDLLECVYECTECALFLYLYSLVYSSVMIDMYLYNIISTEYGLYIVIPKYMTSIDSQCHL